MLRAAPFRSDLDQLHEQLRRAEAARHELEDERRELEVRLALRTRRRGPWIVALLFTAGTAGATGYATAEQIGLRARTRERAAAERARETQISREREEAAVERRKAAIELARCQAERDAVGMRKNRWDEIASCRCTPGDPLCSCLP